MSANPDTLPPPSLPTASTAAPRRSLRQWLGVLGPGMIVGAADDDPAGVATYAQCGAQSGYGLLWLMLISTPMLQVVQVTCAKLGLVTKKGLSALLVEHYGLKIAVGAAVLTTIANVATIGADIAGMCDAAQLVTHVPWRYYVLPLTLFIWYFQVYLDYGAIKKILLVLAATLGSYILAGFLSHPDWKAVLGHTFVPHVQLGMAFLASSVGLLGTTITPYMFYFQSAEEVEERRGLKQLGNVTADTTTGMVFSNIVGYFIIIAMASSLHGRSVEIETAAQAAGALRPFAGAAASYIYAAGIIGCGLLAVPVLAASTASMIGETVGWRIGLNRKASRAPGFYGALSLSLLMGVLLCFSHINPIKALFYSQILDGMVAPILLVLIFRLSARKDILGEQYADKTKVQQAWGWFTVFVMTVAAALLIWGLVTHQK